MFLYLVCNPQIPSLHIYQHTIQILGMIVALLDDLDESVQLTAVSCLLMVIYPLSLFSLCYMYFLIALCLPHSSFLLLHILDSWIIPRWCSRACFAQSFCSAPQSSSMFVAFNIFSLFLLLKWRFIVSYAPKCMELNGIMWSLFALFDLVASQ